MSPENNITHSYDLTTTDGWKNALLISAPCQYWALYGPVTFMF